MSIHKKFKLLSQSSLQRNFHRRRIQFKANELKVELFLENLVMSK